MCSLRVCGPCGPWESLRTPSGPSGQGPSPTSATRASDLSRHSSGSRMPPCSPPPRLPLSFSALRCDSGPGPLPSRTSHTLLWCPFLFCFGTAHHGRSSPLPRRPLACAALGLRLYCSVMTNAVFWIPFSPTLGNPKICPSHQQLLP